MVDFAVYGIVIVIVVIALALGGRKILQLARPAGRAIGEFKVGRLEAEAEYKKAQEALTGQTKPPG